MSSLQLDDGAGTPDRGPGAASVVRVGTEDWVAHRDLRLAMLAADPEAFWARIDEVRAYTEEQWRQEIRGPRIHLQARRGREALGGIAVLPQGYTPEHVIRADQAILVSLWVRPSARGTGISRELLRAAAELAVSMGRPELLLEVDDTNAAARALYQRVGFRETGIRHPREVPGRCWVEYAAHAHQLELG